MHGCKEFVISSRGKLLAEHRIANPFAQDGSANFQGLFDGKPWRWSSQYKEVVRLSLPCY
jgi:hypothetical protein